MEKKEDNFMLDLIQKEFQGYHMFGGDGLPIYSYPIKKYSYEDAVENLRETYGTPHYGENFNYIGTGVKKILLHAADSREDGTLVWIESAYNSVFENPKKIDAKFNDFSESGNFVNSKTSFYIEKNSLQNILNEMSNNDRLVVCPLNKKESKNYSKKNKPIKKSSKEKGFKKKKEKSQLFPSETIINCEKLRVGIEVEINVDTKTISLISNKKNKKSYLKEDATNCMHGVRMEALYMLAKQQWNNQDLDYIKYPFPILCITPNEFEIINGWNIDPDSIHLLKDAGWTLVGLDGSSQEEYINIKSASGDVNEIVKIFGDKNHGNINNRKMYRLIVSQQLDKKYEELPCKSYVLNQEGDF
jgi:hypothetical protein